MTASIDETVLALRGSLLDGLPVEEGIAGTLIVDDVDPRRLLEAWRAARAALPATGRWPVFTLPGGLCWEPTDDDVATLAAAAHAIDPWSVYERYDRGEPLDDWSVLDYIGTFLGSGVLAEAPVGQTPPVTQRGLERWTYDRIAADPDLHAAMQRKYGELATTAAWMSWDAVQLVLLPTDKQWLAPAWISYFGAACSNGSEAWAAAMIQWNRQWGAELVAGWGTMLQYVVRRQPPPGDRAWELAGQLMALGGSLMMGMEQWQLACALSVGDAWFLHDRP